MKAICHFNNNRFWMYFPHECSHESRLLYRHVRCIPMLNFRNDENKICNFAVSSECQVFFCKICIFQISWSKPHQEYILHEHPLPLVYFYCSINEKCRDRLFFFSSLICPMDKKLDIHSKERTIIFICFIKPIPS